MLGGHFLVPQREEGWKWEKGNHQKWMRPRGLGAWGIQTGPFAAPLAKFVQEIYQFFDFNARRPILITPEGGRQKMRKGKSSELVETQGFGCLGQSIWTICSPFSQICPRNFPTFWLSCWEANSCYPRGRKDENEKRDIIIIGWDPGFGCLGHSNWTICSPLKARL